MLNLQSFQSFIRDVISSLKRISKRTGKEMSEEDLQSDAWIFATEISAKRGKSIDFEDPSDQSLILGALHIRNVLRPEKNVRHAVRIDAESENDDGDDWNPWHSRLRAAETTDPLKWKIAEENRLERINSFKKRFEEWLDASYSEYAAYMAALYNFDADYKELCAHLAIVRSTLAARIQAARQRATVQPSVFDGVEKIDAGLIPRAGCRYAKAVAPDCAGLQMAWEFS